MFRITSVCNKYIYIYAGDYLVLWCVSNFCSLNVQKRKKKNCSVNWYIMDRAYTKFWSITKCYINVSSKHVANSYHSTIIE